MPIDLKKCCGTHSRKKEEDGECCQLINEQDNAEQLTYEYTVKIPEQKQIVNE